MYRFLKKNVSQGNGRETCSKNENQKGSIVKLRERAMNPQRHLKSTYRGKICKDANAERYREIRKR